MSYDLISRADALEALGEEPPVWCDEEYEIAERSQWRADVEAIKSVPSADRPKGESLLGTEMSLPKWIPCSERLPERNGAYLVWMQWPCDEEPTVSIINYDADCEMFGEWHEHYNPITFGYLDSDFDEIKGVIAWMPLPEPYKGGEGE